MQLIVFFSGLTLVAEQIMQRDDQGTVLTPLFLAPYGIEKKPMLVACIQKEDSLPEGRSAQRSGPANASGWGQRLVYG
jgi:hypothetical protein